MSGATINTDHGGGVQSGSVTATFNGADFFATNAVVFPVPYGSAPAAVLVVTNDLHFFASVDSVTATGFNFRTVRADATVPDLNTTKTGQWFAIAKPGT